MSTIAAFLALATGGAYAANTIGSADIIDGEVKAADIGVSQVLGSRIIDGTVKAADLADNGVTSTDLTDNGTLSKDIANGAVQGEDIKDGTIRAGDAVRNDFLPAGNMAVASGFAPPKNTGLFAMPCPSASETPVGGGYDVKNAEGGYIQKPVIFASKPYDHEPEGGGDGVDDSWLVGITNETDAQQTLTIWVRCVELAEPEAAPTSRGRVVKRTLEPIRVGK